MRPVIGPFDRGLSRHPMCENSGTRNRRLYDREHARDWTSNRESKTPNDDSCKSSHTASDVALLLFGKAGNNHTNLCDDDQWHYQEDCGILD